MTGEDLFRALGQAGEDRLEKTEWEAENQAKKPGKTLRRILILAAVLAALSGLAIAASASGLVEQLIAYLRPAEHPGEALGEAYSASISVEKPDMRNSAGEPIPMPDMERVELDETLAEQVLGDYVYRVEGDAQLGNTAITLENFIMDELGIATLTFRMKNPGGVSYVDAGYGVVDRVGNLGLYIYEKKDFDPEDVFPEEFYRHYDHLVSESEDGTEVEIVSYCALYRRPIPNEPLYVRFEDDQGGGEIVVFEITPQSYAPSRVLHGDNGKNVRLSAQGIITEWNSPIEISPDVVTIAFTDGTEYQVEAEGILNYVGTLWRTNAWEVYKNGAKNIYQEIVTIFNRIIDPSAVSSVTITYHWAQTDEQGLYIGKATETAVYTP